MNDFMKTGDICDILNGYAFKSSKYVDDGIRVIRITNVQKGFVEDTNPQYYPVSEQWEIEKYMLREGDLLISLTGNVGRVGLLSAVLLPAALNQRVACIRIRNPAVIYKPFLFHLLNSDYFENRCIFASQGVAQKNMSTEWLKECQIPSFSMDKQMEIASIFDKIDALIVSRKEQVRNLDQVVKSRFIELFGDIVLNPFGWEKDYLGVVCDVRDGTHDSPHYHSTGFPLVTSKNVTGGEIDLTDCSLISEADFNKINERSKVDMGDIIMPMIGTVGKPVIVNIKPNFAIKNVSLIKFKDDSRVLNTFIRSLLQSDYFDDAVLSKVRGGTQKFISLGDIRKLVVIVPPMELQEQFAAFVEQTDKSKYYKSIQILKIITEAIAKEVSHDRIR